MGSRFIIEKSPKISCSVYGNLKPDLIAILFAWPSCGYLINKQCHIIISKIFQCNRRD